MKRWKTVILFWLFGMASIFAQDLVFGYTVSPHPSNPNLSVLTVRVIKQQGNNPSPPENLNSFNYGFYFNAEETQVFGLAPSFTGNLTSTQIDNAIEVLPASVDPQQTATIFEINPPILWEGQSYNRLFEAQIFDDGFEGVDIGNEWFSFLSVTFDNTHGTEGYGDFVYMAGTDTNPGWAYSDSEAVDEYDIIIHPIHRTQVLPIHLLSFTVRKESNKEVLLHWQTVMEENASHFEIERSDAGNEWIYLNSLAAQGESNQIVEYNYTDNYFPMHLTSSPWYYYRLKMMDKDGIFSYSPIRAVSMVAEGAMRLRCDPNPNAGQFTLFIDGEVQGSTGVYQIFVYDTKGYLMDSFKSDQESAIPVSLVSQPNGIYLVHVKSLTQSWFTRVVKTD